MADTAEHPHPDFEWGCPECRSPDVQRVHDVPGTRAVSPRYKCRDCGERFWVTVEVRVTEEE